MKRPNFNQRGFTLVELTFVIAIIVVLVSILLPTLFSQIEASKRAKADVDLQEIGAALMGFFNDLDHFPTCDSTSDCNTFESNNITHLAFGEGFGGITADNPSETADWGDLKDTASGNTETTPAKNNGANHLVINSPDGDSSESEATQDYKTTGKKKWRGPYLSRVGKDPWGKNYIAYVGAMESGGQTLSNAQTGTQRGWLISAGENNFLNTGPADTSLSSDDHGFILK